MTAQAPELHAGDFLPGTKYRVVKELGAGGMGVVYQVVKPPNIQGVLKLMSTELTEFEEFRTRFLDEVRVLAQLDHPNIVKVFDYDKLTDGTPYYVMELLHGRTVRDVLATMGTVPPRVAFEITRQLCEALHCAHTHDIPVIHRDIKPENIFLHAPKHGEPVVKLIDFGVVAVADRQHDHAFVGTWKYAAPEQIRGERATPATDLYAVGLVLYEMLCGIGPFEELEGSTVAQAHMRAIPPPVSKFASWVPPSIVQLISSSLMKDPRQRPRDAYEFSERLFELEWANDGNNPHDKTAEGPLSRVLSSAGAAAKASSKNMLAARDRLGDVPVIGVPEQARHGGPTLKGVGQDRHEPTSPGEDALLAGLGATPGVISKKARESDPVVTHGRNEVVSIDGTPRMPDIARASRPAAGTPLAPPVMQRNDVATLDAPPSDPKMLAAANVMVPEVTAPGARDASTLVKSRAQNQQDTDTFATQESAARRAKRGNKWVAIIAFAAIAIVGVGSFVVLRGRAGKDMRTQVTAPPPAETTPTTPSGGNTSVTVSSPTQAPTTTLAPAVTEPSASASAGKKVKGLTGKVGAPLTVSPMTPPPPTNTPAPPPSPATPPPATAPVAPAPKPTNTADPTFIRKLD